MAGYFEFSKSNNALDAEESGRYPATTLGKLLGVSPKAVKAVLVSTEWHHTSSHYNKTDYYDADEARERLEDLKAWQEPKAGEVIHPGCCGEFVDWSGTRNHPKATVVKFEGLEVVEKGDWFTFVIQVTPVMVRKIRKNRNTNGFKVYDSNKRKINGQF